MRKTLKKLCKIKSLALFQLPAKIFKFRWYNSMKIWVFDLNTIFFSLLVGQNGVTECVSSQYTHFDISTC